MKNSVLSILFIFLVSISFANKNDRKSDIDAEKNTVVTLTGQISDQQNDEPLVGVKVVLKGTDKVAYTDFDGKYSFKDIKSGKYSLTASYISYNKSSIEEVDISLKNNQVDIGLQTTN